MKIKDIIYSREEGEQRLGMRCNSCIYYNKKDHTSESPELEGLIDLPCQESRKNENSQEQMSPHVAVHVTV